MILVDTDVLIAHLRGVDAARDWLIHARTEAGGRLAASAVTAAEILGGMRSPERAAVARLLATLHLHPVNEVVARRAGELMREYRRSHGGIGLGDYLVAATAQVQGFDLATLNVEHFPMFSALRPPFAVC
ncbi:MAG: type II toxin-antitoxin system VapC family toxin [Acidimicrobiales bacterium]